MRDTSVYCVFESGVNWVKGQSNHKAHLLHSCSELVSVADVAIVYSKRMKIGGKQVTVVLLVMFVVFTTLGSYNWLLLGLQPSSVSLQRIQLVHGLFSWTAEKIKRVCDFLRVLDAIACYIAIH